MRRPAFLLLAIGLVSSAACNDNGLTTGVDTPTPTPTLTATPTPNPTPTPELCKFYGIDSSSNLWLIDPVAITATNIGPTGIASMTDITITPSNEIIGITNTKAYSIDPATAHSTQIAAAAWVTGQDALDTLPDGRLAVGGGTKLSVVDLSNGQVTPAGTMGGGRVFSGDIAAPTTSVALASGKDSSGGDDHLYSFDLSNNTSTDLGSLGAPKVFGLDYGCDGQLYGMLAQSPPKLIKVNPDTGATTILGSMAGGPATLWGAAGPAD